VGQISLPVQATVRIRRGRSRDDAPGISVDKTHLAGLLLPFIIRPLHDAKRVDPQVAHPQLARDGDGVSEIGIEISH